ncbi:MAG: phosphoglycerate dehydrogenase [Candidatus Omnitrophica bacterium]|nr:phosphoglycerate dehydrogenase [Candidatus Omnitrophota bacterium]
MKVLIADPLGKKGLAVFNKEKTLEIDERPGIKAEELKKIVADYDAIIVRSGTRLTKDIIDAAKKLRVIGRAGVGVDNVDLEAATKRGIIVMNTPEGNTISTAEHTFSMLLSLARNIPQAALSVKGGDWKRHDFLGAEIHQKTLGVVGFGRIGREVAKRASAFGMRVAVFDPFISKSSVKEIAVEFMDLKSLLNIADFITVHTPLTAETKYLLNADTLKLCKKGVKIVNCARGGIIQEEALYQAIKTGRVAGAALDVFEKEPPGDNPLLKLPQVICTPHLGAATQEAQENVSEEVAKQVVDALHERAIKNAVNLPNLDPETLHALRPWLNLAEKIGMLHVQLFPATLKSVSIRYGGEVTRYGLAPLTIAVIKGLLTPICGETVNFVNAPAMAKERGIVVTESTSTQTENFTNYIEVEVGSNTHANRIMGTLFGSKLPRIVNINEFWGLDIDPQGYVLIVKNEDQPGVVGTLGTILGKAKINIAEMSLARIRKGKKTLALTTINTDNAIPDKVLAEIKKFKPILDVKVVKL